MIKDVSKISSVGLNTRKIFLLVLVLMVFILVDTVLLTFYDTIDKNFIPIQMKRIIFSVISILSLVFQLIILQYLIKLNSKAKVDRKIDIRLVSNVLRSSLYLMIVLFGILIFQIFFSNYYDTILLMTIVGIAYGISSLIVAKTIFSFISWYRISHNPIFLLYSASMTIILFNLVLTPLIVNLILNEKPEKIREFAGGSIDVSGGKFTLLSNMVKISSVLSFSGIWLTTAFLMHNTKDRFVKEVRYWGVLSIPLVYFLLAYFVQNIFGTILYPFISSDPVLFSLILTTIFIISKPVGGLIFGLLFWRISRLVSFDRTLREYLIITGYGFLLLFSANQFTLLVLGPFPPFGAVTVTVLMISTYLILIGIYTSATLISANNELRKFIYQTVTDSKFLNLLGKAEVEREIKKTVDRAMKYTSTSDTFENVGIELDENDLKEYVENVVVELKKRKEQIS
jgi:hypothetical protein